MRYKPLPWPTNVPTPRSAPKLTDAPTDGPRVIRWIERNCRFGEGDRFGEPVALELFQKLFLCWLFELKPDGTRRYRRALLEVPKGNGKTPLSAWIGAYMVSTQPSAVIPVAAASYEQAELLFGDLRTCVKESPTLGPLFDAYEGEVQVKGQPSRAYKVAAVAGTNDGQRPSTFLADEIHEWLGNKARVHLVIENGTSKRADSLVLNTTTPGADLDTMAGRMHEYGVRVNTGEIVDPDFLFVWWGADPDAYDLDDERELEAAVRAANPAADKFLNVQDVKRRYRQVPRHEFARYHLGAWTTVSESWLPFGAWDACAVEEEIPAHADVVLGFDGSYNNDSTAIVVATMGSGTPHLDLVRAWEKPVAVQGEWKVPIIEVEDAIRDACRRWNVREIVCDPYRWARSMEVLEGEGLPIVEFPQSPARMTPASQRFYEAAVNGQLTHSGDPLLARHIANAVLKVDSRGSRITKEHRHSVRKIDAAIAAVIALDRVAQAEPDYNVLASFY